MTAGLIARLEAAQAGNRELDAEIAKAIGLDVDEDGWVVTVSVVQDFPAVTFVEPYTTSLDAAISLIPEGCLWKVGHAGDRHPGIFEALIMPRNGPDPHARAATPALALCAAAMKARSVEG